MKKSLLFLGLSSIALSMFAFGGKKLESKKETFVEYGYDALNENNKVEKLNAIMEPSSNNGANKDAGNDASLESSKLGVQCGVNKNNETCIRFMVAVPSLSVQVVFNRTLTLTDGTVSYGQVNATKAYRALANGSEVITPDSLNDQFADADYKYFVAYTLAGIPESEFNANIEVSATVTTIVKQAEESEEAEPSHNEAPKEPKTVEVYKSSNIYKLKGVPDGVVPATKDNVTLNNKNEFGVGAKVIDPVTKSEYLVIEDPATGKLALSANGAKANADGSVSVAGSIYVQIGNDVVEYKVCEVGSDFDNGLTNSTTVVNIPNTVHKIDSNSFWNFNKINTINYDGTVEEWNQITIEAGVFHKNVYNNGNVYVVIGNQKYLLNKTDGSINANAGIPVNTTPGAK